MNDMSTKNEAPQRRIVAKSMKQWPEGFGTRSHWLYACERKIRKGEKPTIFEIEDRQIPIYAHSQTRPSLRLRTDLQIARHEFFRRFWLHSRHDSYLLCDQGTSTIDFYAQRDRGKIVPWFSERLVDQHLLGQSVYGVFAEDSFDQRPARTYWVAADLDLHLATGGNLELFREQVRVIVRHCWGRGRSQIVISSERANGLHIYFFFKRAQDLERARWALRIGLQRIQKAYPELERKTDDWNETLRRAGKTWRVRQIGDLEIYPDQKHGFRFIGTRGKVVLADREIGVVQWGTYARGRKKGQAKLGFDVVGWWESIRSGERMSREEVDRIIESRLPTEQPLLEVAPLDYVSFPDPDEPEPLDSSPQEVPEKPSVDPPKSRSTGGLHRRTRRRIVDYWLGIDNPTGWFETAVIVTARLFAKEGLSQDEAISLLMRYARGIPEDARGCSGRLRRGDWESIDQDIAKAVKNAHRKNGVQSEIGRSNEELGKTIAAWSKYGFRLSDKTTWNQRGGDEGEVVTVQWSEADHREIVSLLMPALKIADSELAVRVATGIVSLTQAKDAEGKGWGYAYLKQWLPDNYGIRCGKQAKQAAVFKALVDLRTIRVIYKGRKGHSTRWTLGSRVLARHGSGAGDSEVTNESQNLGVNDDEPKEWSPWGHLEGGGGEGKKGSTSLCSLINTTTNNNNGYLACTSLEIKTTPSSW